MVDRGDFQPFRDEQADEASHDNTTERTEPRPAPKPLTQMLRQPSEAIDKTLSGLDAMLGDLFDQALAHREANTHEVKTLGEALEAAATGWARLPWSAVGVEGEAEANRSAVTVRCLIRADGTVPDSETEPDLVAVLGRSY